MRLLFIYLFLGSLLFSDEIDRVNSMIKDISEIRNSSTNHSNQEASKKLFIYDEELKSCKDELKNELENNKILRQKLQIKDNKVKALIGVKKKIKAKIIVETEKEIHFRPKPFRLKDKAPIYNAINGKKLYMWEKRRTFTSGTKTEHWIKITGYFTHKKWTEAKLPMWIKKEDTIER